MRGQGRVYRPRDSQLWWLDYYVQGKREREPSGTPVKREAIELLRQRIGDRKAGKIVSQPDRLMLAEDKEHGSRGGLRLLVERQLTIDGRRSSDRSRVAWDNIVRFFHPRTRVVEITASRLNAFAEDRLSGGDGRKPAARSTVNFELAQLRRGYRLAIEQGLLAVMPVFKIPKPRNARTGFFEPGEFFALLAELPDALRGLIRFLRATGWRRNEAVGLTWDQVDRDGCVIRLAGAQTKSGEPRIFPYGSSSELTDVLGAQWEARSGPFVFQRGGKRIGRGALRGSWRRACTRAGLEGRLVHDLRRTAARDFRRAGVSEGEIMKLCGWETRSMFDRYNIIDERDLAEAVARRDQYRTDKERAKSDPVPVRVDLLS